MIDFINVNIGGKTLRLFKTVVPGRLSEETHEEYRMRRRYVNDEIKAMRKGKNWEKRMEMIAQRNEIKI